MRALLRRLRLREWGVAGKYAEEALELAYFADNRIFLEPFK
jgi:hypothetical protein